MTYYNSWAIGFEALKQERNTHKKCESDVMLSKSTSRVDTNLNTNLVKTLT